jgi:hypothetical protein
MSRTDPPFKADLWRFLLLRAIHDLGNSVSGILTLSTHHLRNELPPEEVTESFKLIRESAESARQMLIAVGSLTDEESDGTELVRASDFLAGLLAQLERIVPRSVSLQLHDETGDAIIEVDAGRLRQAFVTLVAVNCSSFGAKAGSIRLGGVVDSGKIWMVYTTTDQMSFNLTNYAKEIFGKLDPPPADVASVETDAGMQLRIGFLPVPDLATAEPQIGGKEL